jgi:hypothetical protein
LQAINTAQFFDDKTNAANDFVSFIYLLIFTKRLFDSKGIHAMSRVEKISYHLLCESMLKNGLKLQQQLVTKKKTPTTTDEHSSEVQNHSINRPND